MMIIVSRTAVIPVYVLKMSFRRIEWKKIKTAPDCSGNEFDYIFFFWSVPKVLKKSGPLSAGLLSFPIRALKCDPGN